MFDHLEEQKSKEEKSEAKRPSPGGDLILRNTIDRLTSGRVSVASPFVATTHELESRLKKLEEKGRKRGKRFSVIGIVGGTAITLLIMYFGYIILTDVINITGKMDESTSAVPEMRHNKEKIATTTDQQVEASTSTNETQPLTDTENASSSSLLSTANASSSSLLPGDMIEKASSSSEDPISTSDFDNDGLSYEQEMQYQTDPNNADTDGDGYLDGQEVRGGYDPKK